MNTLLGYLFLLTVLCHCILRAEGQSQSWNTNYAGNQDQDGGSDKQHWASGKAGNGGQQFMSMSNLYEKMENVFGVDQLFADNSATIKNALTNEPANPAAPDVEKEAAIENAVDEMDIPRHQAWASAAIDNIFNSLPDLGLDVEFPVLLPMLVPVRFLADKDIDINIEQIYSPPPTEEDSLNDGGSKFHQNTEKLHIHVGPKEPAIPAESVIYTKDALLYGDEGFLFTGKLTLKRRTLCKVLCLRGTDYAPSCCDCEGSGGGRKRGIDVSGVTGEKGNEERSANFYDMFSASKECSFLGASFVSGGDVTESDCSYCKCFDGEIVCFVRKTCLSLQGEQHKIEAELDEVRRLIIEKGSNTDAVDTFKQLKADLTALQNDSKEKHEQITETLKSIFEGTRGASSEMKDMFLSRYQEEDHKAKILNYRKNELLKNIIQEIKMAL